MTLAEPDLEWWQTLPRDHPDRGRAEVMLRAGCTPTEGGRGWEGGTCCGCGKTGRRLDYSHRVAEGQGGPVTAANGIALCGPGGSGGCHGWASSRDRTLAERLGWILPEGTDPARTPMWLVTPSHPTGGWWLAGWFDTDPPEAAHVLLIAHPADYLLPRSSTGETLPDVPDYGPPWATWRPRSDRLPPLP